MTTFCWLIHNLILLVESTCCLVLTSMLNPCLHGRRTGPPGSPVALKTIFGWVLAGKTSSNNSCHVTSHHVSTSLTDDDILRRFCEIEELTPNKSSPSIEDQSILNHIKNTHCQNQKGRFIVPLPRCTNVGPLGESRSQAVRRFIC